MSNQEKEFHNGDINNNTYFDDTYDSMVKETCWYCRETMTEVEDIYVSVEEDRYICLDCANKYNIQIVKCLEIYKGEE